MKKTIFTDQKTAFLLGAVMRKLIQVCFGVLKIQTKQQHPSDLKLGLPTAVREGIHIKLRLQHY